MIGVGGGAAASPRDENSLREGGTALAPSPPRRPRPPPPLPGGPARGRAGLGEAQGLPLAQMGKLEDFYEISPKFMKSVEFHEI